MAVAEARRARVLDQERLSLLEEALGAKYVEELDI
jgi:hypothetical protein